METNQPGAFLTRREFMGATALGAVWLAAAAACARDAGTNGTIDSTMQHGPGAESAAPPQELVHFTKAQAADIEAMAARIIPTDDTPGAREAGVVFFVDRSLTGFAKDQAPLFDSGLLELSKTVQKDHGAAATFASLTEAQQDVILTGMEKSDFFGAMRFATIAGFLSLPKYGGNKDYLGWTVVGQEHTFAHTSPFGWYDRPENQQALLGTVL